MLLDDLDKGRLLVAGVSGGADSLTLLGMLHEAGFPLVACHFNHRLRPEAEADAAFVETVARSLGLPFESGSADVGAFALANHLSVEEAARKLRYRFLFACARSHAAQGVAVGHTADDQVETVLMHFVRGAGLSGLKGMLPRTLLPEFDAEIPLFRPLLHLWRADTEAYCRAHDLDFRTDLSNADQTYFRNRLRLSLIPGLERYNTGFKQALLRSSQAMQGDFELLTSFMEAAWERTVVEQESGFVAFDAAAFGDLPLALRRNLIRRAAAALRPGLRDVDFQVLERAATTAGRPGTGLPFGSVDLAGGLRLFSEGDRLYLAGPEAELPSEQWPQILGDPSQTWEWEGSGSLSLANGWVLEAKVCEAETALTMDYSSFSRAALRGNLPESIAPNDSSAGEPGFTAWLDAASAGNTLRVRAARPGDRIEPLGMAGKTVKLSDLFINLKVPRRARARWPLVCAGDEVAWVPGLRQSDRFRIVGKPERFWLIVARRAGPSPRE